MREVATNPVQNEWSEVLALIEQRSGVVFNAARRKNSCAHLRAHMQQHRLASAAEMLRLLLHSPGEYDAVLDRLMDERSRFFRAPAAFQALAERVLPEMHLKKFWDKPRSLRLWSAGCGAGEEPYSIALTLADCLGSAEPWNLHLLATDLSQQALQHAGRGVYSAEALAAVSAEQIDEFFVRAGAMYMVKPQLRHMVTFSRMNLVDGAYMGRFDVIFCIGVLELLRPDHRARVLQRFYECMEPGGYLFLSPDEEVAELVRFDEVQRDGVLLWQKPAGLRRLPAYAAELA